MRTSNRRNKISVNTSRWTAYAAAGAASALACQDSAEAGITHVVVNSSFDGAISSSASNSVLGSFALAGSAMLQFAHLGVISSSTAAGSAFAGVTNGMIAGFWGGSSSTFPYAQNMNLGANVSAAPGFINVNFF